MTYSVLKSIDLTNCMNSFICFLVSCSYGVGQVSPVRLMAFWRILLSFSSCVHLKMMSLIVCSSCSLQGHVEFGIILNLCRYNLFKPWPVTIAVNSSDIGRMVFILSLIDEKNNLLTAPLCVCMRARARVCARVCVRARDICAYIYICLCVCVCVYIYIYI